LPTKNIFGHKPVYPLPALRTSTDMLDGFLVHCAIILCDRQVIREEFECDYLNKLIASDQPFALGATDGQGFSAIFVCN